MKALARDLAAFAALCACIGLIPFLFSCLAISAEPEKPVELPAWKFGKIQHIEVTLFP